MVNGQLDEVWKTHMLSFTVELAVPPRRRF